MVEGYEIGIRPASSAQQDGLSHTLLLPMKNRPIKVGVCDDLHGACYGSASVGVEWRQPLSPK